MKKISGIIFLLIIFCVVFSNIVIAPPSNEPPIADFTYTPNIPTTQDIIQFTDTSTKGTSIIISWSWDFGDGEGSHLQNPTHQYSDDGTYNVTLTVMDEAGLEDDETKNITVGNTPPEAYFTYTPLNPTTADIIQFIDASTDVDGEIVAWLWDFGDGETSTLENPEHQYEKIGEIPVILRVEDDDMDFAFYDIKLFIYGANIPEADANGPYLGEIGEPIDFNGSGSSDPDGEIVAYDWDFGDGNTGTGLNPSHIYNEIGVYTVILTVEDDDGFTDNDTTTATITDYQNNPPNKPTITGPSKGKPGEEYTYYAVTTDPDGENVSYLFNWGNNITSFIMGPYPSGVECNASTIWFDEGTFNVTVKAIDVYGAESEWSDPLVVSMPKTKAKTIDIILLRILENYPLLYKILHRFLKL
jgi:PKD repeat protein